MNDPVTPEVRRAADSPAFRAAARSGFAASGVVQGLVGVLAIQVATQAGGADADQAGALRALTDAPGGAVVVWLAAIGGFALALWLVVDGLLERGSDPKAVWKERLKSWAKAIVYGAIGVTGLRVELGVGGDTDRATRESSRTLLSLPLGQLLLGAVGLGVVAAGAFLVHRGIAKRFLETIRVPAEPAGRAVVLLGQVGYAARGVAIGMIGALLVVAAVQGDAGRATGLDGALRAFADLPAGKVLLTLIGAGWIASGVYSVARARLARLD